MTMLDKLVRTLQVLVEHDISVKLQSVDYGDDMVYKVYFISERYREENHKYVVSGSYKYVCDELKKLSIELIKNI